eukprot:jgi/Orpsp1_1/1184261/evm.model.c7180000088760.1
MTEISKETLEAIVIGLIILIVILLIILIICCCKNSKKRSNTPQIREVKFTSGTSNNMNSSYVKSFEMDDNNTNGFKSFYSQASEKPMLDSSTINSYSMKNHNNSNDYIDMPPASYNSNIMNHSVIENMEHGSLNRGYVSPTISVNNANYISYDIGNPSLHRISYSSTNATNDSQYQAKNIMNYSFTEINDARKARGHNTLEYNQSKLSPTISINGRITSPSPSIISNKMSSPVIATSIPGNLGRNNLKTIPMINDLHENSLQGSSSPRDRSYLNPIIYQKSPMSKNYNMENVPGHLTPNQNGINIGNLHIGPSVNIEDLDECNVDDVDAIVDDAEIILDALSHHSFSSSNNQSASLLGATATSPRQRNSNLSNVAIKTRNSVDYQDLSFSSQNPVDAIVGGMNSGIIQRGRSNSQNNSFQKTIPLQQVQQVQVHSINDIYLRQIPEDEVVSNNNENESVIDQTGYNTSFNGKATRSYRNSRNYEGDGLRNVNIIPSELKANESSFCVEEVTSPKYSKYVHLRDHLDLDKDTDTDIDINDLSKVKIQKLYESDGINNNSTSYMNLRSPPTSYCNLNNINMNNSKFLNYKKEQIKSNVNVIGQNQIQKQSKNFNIANIDTSFTNNTTSSNNINDQQQDSFIIQDSIMKSPTNFIKSPLSPINSNEDLINLNKSQINKISMVNDPLEKNTKAIRSSSLDDYSSNSRMIKNQSQISATNINPIEKNTNAVRSSSLDDYNSNPRMIKNQSQISVSTINSTISRNGFYPSISRNHFSSLSRCDEANSSILSESSISVENINAPNIKHSHKLNNTKKRVPL